MQRTLGYPAFRRYMMQASEQTKNFFLTMQEFFHFGARSFATLSSARRYWRDVVDQMYACGTESIPIVVVSSMAIGSLLTLEVGKQLSDFGAKMLTGRATALSVIREMAPIVTGLMLASRVGARNGSELGSMRITEQIDALRAFGTDPVAKLVMPRLLASLLMFLPLTAVSVGVGLVSGAFIASSMLGIDSGFYWNSVLNLLVPLDFVIGFVKPPVFAVLITLVTCYSGFAARGGTTGVGRATIKGIVVSSGLVLIANFILTRMVLELMS